MRKTTITYKQPSAAMPVAPVEKHEVKEDASAINHSTLALWIGGFAGMGAAALSVLLLVFVLVKRGINADLLAVCLIILIAVGGLLHKSRCAAYEYIGRSRRF